MRRKRLATMVFVLLLAYTIIGGGTRTAFGLDLPVIYVDPEISNTKKGSDFTVDINIANVTWDHCDYGIFGWEFRMTFNASLLEAIDVEEGSYLMIDPWEDRLFTTSVDNEAGIVIANNFLAGYPDEGAIGSGTLANVTFHTLAEGAGSLHLNKTVLRTFNWDTYEIEPVDHTAEDGSVTVGPGHDVAVASITAPSKTSVNSNVPINVTVKNEGSFTETGNVTLYYNITEIGTQSFTDLASCGTTTNVSFSWNTAGLAQGSYTLNATVTIPVDDDPHDNSKTEPIALVEHDIAVTNIDAPKKVTIEETVTISVTVENLGIFTEAFNLTVSYDSTPIGFNDTTELPAGDNSIVSFSWNSSGLTPGEYDINATATIMTSISNPSGTDDDPTDNSKTKPISLMQVHDLAVVSITGEAVAANSTVLIGVEVRNEGSFVEVANVSIYYIKVTDTFIDTKNVTLAPLTSTTVTLTWNTSSVTPDVYTLKTNVTNPEGIDHDANDNTLYDTVYLPPIEGDVNGDGKVDNPDLFDLAEAYGSEPHIPPTPPDPNWNLRCDLNWDSIVDVSDLFDLSKNYGKPS